MIATSSKMIDEVYKIARNITVTARDNTRINNDYDLVVKCKIDPKQKLNKNTNEATITVRYQNNNAQNEFTNLARAELNISNFLP